MKILDLLREDLAQLKEEDDADFLARMSKPLTPDEIAKLQAVPHQVPGAQAVNPNDPQAADALQQQHMQQLQQQQAQQQQWQNAQAAAAAQRHQALPAVPQTQGGDFAISADQARQMNPDQFRNMYQQSYQPNVSGYGPGGTAVLPLSQLPPEIAKRYSQQPGTAVGRRPQPLQQSRSYRLPSLKEIFKGLINK